MALRNSPVTISPSISSGSGISHWYIRHGRVTRCPAKLNVNWICMIVKA
ncbi:MAG TPA: hypothetical protein VHZ25_03735 [Acidobacteriaceae bacterium]|nr:hypothetical protein [Acidobacteriaceae bacterium]